MRRRTYGRRTWRGDRYRGASGTDGSTDQGPPHAVLSMEIISFTEQPCSGAGRPSLRADPHDEALRGLYLKRLQRLLGLRQRHEQDLNPQGLHLMDRSIFTAYCDCREVGAGEEARRILREVRVIVDEPAMPLGGADAGSG